MAAQARFVAVARNDEVEEAKPYGTAADGVPVLLVRLDGTLHAIGRICTHQDADLAEGTLEGVCIVCPLHGSKFDVRTGAALTLPAFEPEPVFEVLIEDGIVFVATERYDG